MLVKYIVVNCLSNWGKKGLNFILAFDIRSWIKKTWPLEYFCFQRYQSPELKKKVCVGRGKGEEGRLLNIFFHLNIKEQNWVKGNKNGKSIIDGKSASN